MPLTILVTAFGPFPGAPRNPSQAVVDRLARAQTRLARLGLRLETRVLPVVFSQTQAALATALRETRAHAVLHIGLAGRRKAIGVELRARNRLSPLFPDADKRNAAPLVERGGAAFRRARFPVRQTVATLRRRGLMAEASRDAGAYVCNQTLYLTLGGDTPVVGFIHIPRPRGNLPLARRRRARMTIEAMGQGLEDVLIRLAAALQKETSADLRREIEPDSAAERGRKIARLFEIAGSGVAIAGQQDLEEMNARIRLIRGMDE